jgi:hypothetical protein
VNVVSLQDGLNTVETHIRFVRRVLPHVSQPLKRSSFISERFQESVRELGGVASLFEKLADCFFNLYRLL